MALGKAEKVGGADARGGHEMGHRKPDKRPGAIAKVERGVGKVKILAPGKLSLRAPEPSAARIVSHKLRISTGHVAPHAEPGARRNRAPVARLV